MSTHHSKIQIFFDGEGNRGHIIGVFVVMRMLVAVAVVSIMSMPVCVIAVIN